MTTTTTTTTYPPLRYLTGATYNHNYYYNYNDDFFSMTYDDSFMMVDERRERNVTVESCASVVNGHQKIAWIEKYLGECVRTPMEQAGFYLGIISLLFWFVSYLPQVSENYRRKKSGLTFRMLIIWFLGDLCNLFGVIVIGGLLTQVTNGVYYVAMDLVMMMQYVVYEVWYCRHESRWWPIVLCLVCPLRAYKKRSGGGGSGRNPYVSIDEDEDDDADAENGGGGDGDGDINESDHCFDSDCDENDNRRNSLRSVESSVVSGNGNVVLVGGGGVDAAELMEEQQQQQLMEEEEGKLGNNGSTMPKMMMAMMTMTSNATAEPEINTHVSSSVSPSSPIGGNVEQQNDDDDENDEMNQEMTTPLPHISSTSHLLAGYLVDNEQPSSPSVSPSVVDNDVDYDYLSSASKRRSKKRKDKKLYLFSALYLGILVLCYLMVSTMLVTEDDTFSSSPSSYNLQVSSSSSLLINRMKAGGRRLLGVTSDDPKRDEDEWNYEWPPRSPMSIFGYIVGCLSSFFYFTSRLPQFWTNMRRKSCEGLAPLLFYSAFMGNLTYVISIVLYSQNYNYIMVQLPWIVGAFLVFSMDLSILFQFVLYRYILKTDKTGQRKQQADSDATNVEPIKS